jgi:hypothetical protein
MPVKEYTVVVAVCDKCEVELPLAREHWFSLEDYENDGHMAMIKEMCLSDAKYFRIPELMEEKNWVMLRGKKDITLCPTCQKAHDKSLSDSGED